MNKTIHLQDNLLVKADDMAISAINHSNGKNLFAKTELIVGTGNYYTDKFGMTQLGEPLLKQSNLTVLGGALMVLEKLFATKPALKVAYLDTIMPGVVSGSESPLPSDTSDKEKILLFGVGTGGAGESGTDIKPVKFFNREIPGMIPIRQTAASLSGADSSKYWFRKQVQVKSETKTAYYLKEFDAPVEIKSLWLDGAEGEDGSTVNDNVYTTPTSNNTGITTFAEMAFSLNRLDVREHFTDLGGTEPARINSVGIFTAYKHEISSGQFDYRRVKLFSLINLYNEIFANDKTLRFLYRIYTS